jgi:hypothetical protein
MTPETRTLIDTELELIGQLQEQAEGLRWKLAVFRELLQQRAAQSERLKDWWRERRLLHRQRPFSLPR